MEDITNKNEEFAAVTISQTTQDAINAALIVSVVINLVVFIVWLVAR